MWSLANICSTNPFNTLWKKAAFEGVSPRQAALQADLLLSQWLQDARIPGTMKKAKEGHYKVSVLCLGERPKRKTESPSIFVNVTFTLKCAVRRKGWKFSIRRSDLRKDYASFTLRETAQSKDTTALSIPRSCENTLSDGSLADVDAWGYSVWAGLKGALPAVVEKEIEAPRGENPELRDLGCDQTVSPS